MTTMAETLKELAGRELYLDNKRFKQAQEIGRKKQLRVQRNVLVPGYCVTMPNGGTFNPITSEELLRWVQGY